MSKMLQYQERHIEDCSAKNSNTYCSLKKNFGFSRRSSRQLKGDDESLTIRSQTHGEILE